MKTYVIKKEKIDRAGKKFYREVGSLLIRDGEKTGVLNLNWLDEDFAVFERDDRKDGQKDERAVA